MFGARQPRLRLASMASLESCEKMTPSSSRFFHSSWNSSGQFPPLAASLLAENKCTSVALLALGPRRFEEAPSLLSGLNGCTLAGVVFIGGWRRGAAAGDGESTQTQWHQKIGGSAREHNGERPQNARSTPEQVKKEEEKSIEQ